MFGSVILATGWTFEEVGELTPVQIGVVMKAITEERKQQAAMWGAKVEENADRTAELEQKLARLKKETGREKFDLRELI